MKGKRIREFLKKKKAVGCAVLAAALIVGGIAVWQPTQEPEFPSFTDPVMEEVSLEEEETPLGSEPEVTTKTTKKKSTKTVKLKKASTKTYTKKLPTTTKKKTSTKTTGDTTVTTNTTIVTATTEKYTKKKKTKKVTKVVTTTVKTTTVTETAETADSSAESVDSESVGTETSASSDSADTSAAKTASTEQKYEADVATLAPKMNSQVLSAYKTLGFKVYVDPSVTSYSGYFDAKSQMITVRSEDSTIYHELGHFLAFIANNYDKSTAFASVYSSEKGLYTGTNKVYVTSSASEYFAESVRDYINDPTSLKASRPKTYEAVETALAKITDTQVARIKNIYGAFWN